MKYLITIALCLGICAALTRAEEVCHTNVINACSVSSLTGNSICNSRYAGIEHIEGDVQAYANHELAKSYQYLLMATHFNSYQKNRPGFQKLYQSMSDRSFDNTIELIKQLSRRGGKADFNARHKFRNSISDAQLALEVDELHSLAIALDAEKALANNAVHCHVQATHNKEQRDPEMAHFLEEKFLGSQAASIRKLSGYANDLAKIMNQPDPSLGVYLFDEHLSKQ